MKSRQFSPSRLGSGSNSIYVTSPVVAQHGGSIRSCVTLSVCERIPSCAAGRAGGRTDVRLSRQCGVPGDAESRADRAARALAVGRSNPDAARGFVGVQDTTTRCDATPDRTASQLPERFVRAPSEEAQKASAQDQAGHRANRVTGPASQKPASASRAGSADGLGAEPGAGHLVSRGSCRVGGFGKNTTRDGNSRLSPSAPLRVIRGRI